MSDFSYVLMGHESLLIQCGEKLLSRGHENAVAVVTDDADITTWAAGHHLTVIAPGAGLADRLTALRFDWLLSIANLRIIPQNVLDHAALGAVNFHDGPLPRYAGLNAPVWALLNGESQHGVTWHMIEGGIDEGDILATQSVTLSEQDNALTLNTKCYDAAMRSFDTVIDQLETGAPTRIKQDLGQRTYVARDDRPHAAAHLDFRDGTAPVLRMVRALDHGGYWNPMALPKLMLNGHLVFVGAAELVKGSGVAAQVLSTTKKSLTVATYNGAVELSDLRGTDGQPFDPSAHVKAGDLLTTPADPDALTEAMRDVARNDGFWRQKLAHIAPVQIPTTHANNDAADPRPITLASQPTANQVARWAVALSGMSPCDLAYSNASLLPTAARGFVAPWVPLRADEKTIHADIDAIGKRTGFAIDLPARDPNIGSVQTPQIGFAAAGGLIAGTLITVTSEGTLIYDAARVPTALATLLAARLESGSALPDGERDAVVNQWNATQVDYDASPIHHLFQAQVAKTPDATALVFEGESLTYAQLDARANRVAHVLIGMGVGPETLVGLCCHRSLDLVIGALGLLKAGGAYVPLDPAYPADRLAHYITDSAAPVIVTQSALADTLPPHQAKVLSLDTDARLNAAPETAPDTTTTGSNLAYLIYTSGSTGTPKGVMVEHGNVANFFAGMDDRITHDPAGTWLSVTSLSFDISVLELFWTLARGFKLVLSGDETRALVSGGDIPGTNQGMDFSLYYWGNDDLPGPSKYELLLEGAKYADENGFVAVWTPERHFHAFGGPYPNPSVTGAAVAGLTKNIGVRSGSCVGPLHHPARLAEEWSVIDNLTNGKAGLAIASGWQPDDFVLRPENTPPNNKPAMLETITTLRKLWRGEPVEFPRQDGTMHAVVTQPRPVSKEPEIWVTTAGNPETWKEAARLNANVLTHLLGQSIDEVAGKIELYRETLRAEGFDPDKRKITLMLHTYLDQSREAARDVAREPMKDYLRSAAGLIKQYAWAFPAFKKPEGVKNPFELDLGSLDDDELEGILDFAFERYFEDSGMFGTAEDGIKRAADLKAIGVTEIACLIDYGIDTQTVLQGLRPLTEVRNVANAVTELAADDFSIAAQIVRHDVTHVQCTPSMARLMSASPEARNALARVKNLMIGGEALPGAMVAEFASFTKASIENMYGPTETTIWSSTQTAEPVAGVMDIGLPIANTQLYVLDDAQNPVPVGIPGELFIGGDGVTRGYWRRETLTDERFVPNPFHAGRMYRTGDLVRRRADGRIDFIGRVDHQVKLRGFRIELGEIEAVLESQDEITGAVTIAREDTPGDVRLVGYVTADKPIDTTALRNAISAKLPAHMLPSALVQLDAFPLTPNKKVDRKELPKPQTVAPASSTVHAPASQNTASPTAAPASANVQEMVANVWKTVLGVANVSPRDSFFDLGGHSLLAVQTHRMLRDDQGVKGLSITDIFRFPVMGDLAAKVQELTGAPMQTPPAANTGAPENDRANSRQDAMARRREMRARRRA